MSAPPRLTCVGLLGLPGAGKSTVASMLAERGCTVLDADSLVASAYQAPEVQESIRGSFEEDLLDGNGRPRRDVIAALVFSDDEARQRLEGILHPWVRSRVAETLDDLGARLLVGVAGLVPVAVLDIPLLAEGGLAARCDCFVFVEASVETRVARRGEERGWDHAEMARREAAQWNSERKKAVAGARPIWTVSNEGDLAATRRALDACWQEMISLSKED